MLWTRILTLALLLCGLMSGARAQTTGAIIPGGYLTTSGNQIVASTGANVRLACSGYNEPTGNYTADGTALRTAGNNCVRIPWYDAGTCSGGTCNFSTFDTIVSAMGALGMRVIFDHHGNEQNNLGVGCLGQQSNGLWYDLNGTVAAGITWSSTNNTDGCPTPINGTVNYATFKANWVQFATHYASNSTVIGFDMHNEPLVGGNTQVIYGNWGGNNGSDMRAMCQDTGSAIHAVNAGVLIICEGLINFQSSLLLATQNPTYGNGGSNVVPGTMDLSQTVSYPVSISGKAVYSIHDYPGHISAAYPDSGSTKISSMNSAWGYLATYGLAPVFVGELGADLDNSDGNLSDDLAWANTVVPYLNGADGASGGPTFSGLQQPVSSDWWNFGDNPGQEPNGICANSGCAASPSPQFKPGQQAFWSTLLYTAPAPPPGPTTWNPLDKTATITLSSGNTVATSGTTAGQGVRSTTSKSTGNACFEVILTNVTNSMAVGISNASENLTGYLGGSSSQGLGLYTQFGPGQQIYVEGTAVSQGVAPSTNGVKVKAETNFTTDNIWYQTDQMIAAGTPWNNSATANPETGVGGIPFGSVGSGPWFIEVNTQDSGSVFSANFGPGDCTASFPGWSTSPMRSTIVVNMQ